MDKKFHIMGLRHCFVSGMQQRIGVVGTRFLWVAAMMGLLTVAVFLIVFVFGKDSSFADDANTESVVDIRFLNTQNGDGLASEYGGESNLIKTKDNKYVLIDTGNEDQGIRKRIKKALDDYQQKSNGTVTIDYLIISHLDQDHHGNATELINNKNIEVKNVVVKREGTLADVQSSKGTVFDDIIRAARKEGADIYSNAYSHKVDGKAVSDYGKKYHRVNTEGTGDAVIQVGNYLTLYFYNTTDVFSGKTCTKGYKFKFTANTDTSSYKFLKDSKGRYYRINNTAGTFPNFTYEYSNTLESGPAGFNSYYYAFNHTEDDGSYKQSYTCLSNANSYGILAEIKTDAANKYVYFPNDLDNYGYDLKPTTTDVTYYSSRSGKNVTVNNHQVYGNGVGKVYKGHTLSDLVNNNLTANQNKTYSETKVAYEIADKLGSDLSNLVIYQISHHGSNNAPDAMDILNINRSNMYAINNRKSNVGNGDNIISRKTYYYALGNVNASNKLYSGYNKGNGVYCAINSAGTTKCGYNEITTKTLSYDMNGGSGSVATQSCWSDAACSVAVSSAIPTRSDYSFLGWATSANSTVATYHGGETVSLASDLKLYAIWAPVYTLSYNANGGTGTLNNQTCSPTTTTGSCTITISASNPTRDGYSFLGWNTAADAVSSAYANGSRLTLNGNRTLYAVWKEKPKTININTSVNGGNGRISSSLMDIVTGTRVIITFTPNSGYEIDNVKVDDVISDAVVNNKLTIYAGTQDINIVVTYKVSEGGDEPTPGPTPDPEVSFSMNFDAVSGGDGYPDSVSCTTTTDRCEVIVPNQMPQKDGHVFLGYGLPVDANTVLYVPGNTYELTSDLYVVAIWAPIYTLSYDMNEGVGVIENQTCNSNVSPTETCSVTISNIEPTKEGSKFFGWALRNDATLPDYLPGDILTFASGITQVKLYAVWLNESSEVEWWQGQNYEHESMTDLIIKIDYPLSNFVSLSIDGAQLDETVYSLRSGSTIITIDGEYVDTLADGGHMLEVVYRGDNVVETGFTVSSKNPVDPDEGSGGDDDDDEYDPADKPDEAVPDDNAGDNNYNDDYDDIIVPNTGSNTDDGNGEAMSMTVMIPLLIIVACYVYRRFIARKKHFGFEKHQN